MQSAHERFFQSKLPGLWQMPRIHGTTLWMKRPCHLNTSGNYITSSWKFSKTNGQVYYFGHLTCPQFPGVRASRETQLYGLPSSLLGKSCSWWSFARFLRTWRLRTYDCISGCWSGDGQKFWTPKREMEELRIFSLLCYSNQTKNIVNLGENSISSSIPKPRWWAYLERI